MAATALAALLLAAAAQNVTVETLGENRFRLMIVYAGSSAEAHARAQLRLIEEAERLCLGRGRPVSEGSLEANQAPGRRGRIALSAIYSCGSAASR